MEIDYNGFLLTWNPDRWEDEAWFSDSVARSARGERPDATRWSSAGRKHGYLEGDRVFLLKQGAAPRGIVGSGWIDDDQGPYQAPHWDGSGRPTTYVNVDWEHLIDPDDPLPIADLTAATHHTSWRPQSSGTMIAAEDLSAVEGLWARHTGLFEPESRPGRRGHGFDGPRRQRPRSAGWERDPELRRKAEDYAQGLLEQSFRDQHWNVQDTRYGNPYDAIATRGHDTRFLEAKGTRSDGQAVQVTAGEVRFARDQPRAVRYRDRERHPIHRQPRGNPGQWHADDARLVPTSGRSGAGDVQMDPAGVTHPSNRNPTHGAAQFRGHPVQRPRAMPHLTD